jgi:hypothetical protein
MAKAVFCLTRTENQAVMIVDRLKAAGFSNNEAIEELAYPSQDSRSMVG